MSSIAAGAPDEAALAPGSIVVGHDGSAQSDRALAVALDLAQALSVPVVIVRAWSIETAPHGTIFHDGYAASFAEITAAVRERLRAETADLVARYPGCRVDVRGVLGQPSEVLAGASAGARMLVVGSRGLGGFAGLLLGSVSEQCIRHARCPVLVVPMAG
ncbi:MAG: universal stress protein [Herbiconiux sp.]|uniref:universal stress protein n=1 Tax=Herbiconiux sp. TaxID=1871186 RepID=UPI0011FFC75C|nr:universal stress protein [Herbiconiux sp.]TAJ48182.1 MAG: universal stress protein [Herbiconiux sp.]